MGVRKRMRVMKSTEIALMTETNGKECSYCDGGSGVGFREREMWPKFRELAKHADMLPIICKSDWLLHLAMSQEVTWDDKWALEEA